MFDFHTHLDFYDDKDIENIGRCIVENKIKTFAASVDIESFERNLKIKNRIREMALESGLNKEASEDLVGVSFGVHPSYCKDLPVKENDAVELLWPYYEQSRIISEAGLDFFWEKECPKEVQLMHLLVALDHAHKNKKVIVLHTKGAEKEILSVLKDFPNAKPVIHWYDGPVQVYEKFISNGYYQTFGCELKYSENIKTFLRMTPLELILPETDNPTGEPWLGGIDSSPCLIKRVYSDISEVLGKSVSETSELLENNLKSLLAE